MGFFVFVSLTKEEMSIFIKRWWLSPEHEKFKDTAKKKGQQVKQPLLIKEETTPELGRKKKGQGVRSKCKQMPSVDSS